MDDLPKDSTIAGLPLHGLEFFMQCFSLCIQENKS